MIGNVEIVVRDVQPNSKFCDNSVLDKVFSSRGVTELSDLDRSLSALCDPLSMPDIVRAAERLVSALFSQEKILIVGDFDADGATSVAVCLLCLRSFGFQNVEYLVPNRFEFGYGLSPEIVELALISKPNVILTVDNGTSSFEGVAKANEAGVEVVITDHHLAGHEIPQAFALVNPTLVESKFPSKCMAGVGVAYYLMGVIRSLLRERNWFDRARPEPNLAEYLDLVALGTVADVVPLDKNNRALVYNGLKRMRAGHCRPGIQALAEISDKEIGTLSAQDLGFAIGPRLNAAGRLDDISTGIKCLIEEDLAKARAIASNLNQLNKERREIEREMTAEADLLLSEQYLDTTKYGIGIYSQIFHQGVVGILAGRIKEKLNRPVIAFSNDSDSRSGELKGSARSIEGLHIRDLLDQIAVKYPGLILRFGGHAMAAGLSIKKVHFERFCVIFDDLVKISVDPAQLEARVFSDGELISKELSMNLVKEIELAGPWGSQFPEPTFHGQFALISQRIVGDAHLKLVLAMDERLVDAIAFRQPFLDDEPKQVRVVYKPQVNRYAGSETLQLLVEHIESIA